VDKIGFLNSGVIRALLVAVAGLAGLIVRKLGFSFDDDFWNQVIDAALLVLTAGATVWAGWSRATKPTPPITEAAAKATQERMDQEASGKQGGYVRTGLLLVMLAISGAGAAVLSGCQALGLPAAKTFNERLAAGYTTVTAVREATSSWVDGQVRIAQGEPDLAKRTQKLAAVRADAQNIQAQADTARQGLDVARGLKGVDLKNAEARLASTLRILQALQQYLGSK
jgi:hypothetical protein